MRNAYHSACISAAIQDSKKDYIVIFEIIGELDTCEDKSCDISDDEIRTCIQLEELNNLINSKKIKIIIHKYRYHPNDRAKYLYNTYHNCGGTRWNSIKNHIINKESLMQELLKLEEEYDYEYWFNNIYETIK